MNGVLSLPPICQNVLTSGRRVRSHTRSILLSFYEQQYRSGNKVVRDPNSHGIANLIHRIRAGSVIVGYQYVCTDIVAVNEKRTMS